MTGHSSVNVPFPPTLPTIAVPDSQYCSNFKTFGNAYRKIHGYSSVTVCTFGVLANTLNLIVLTRKEMINSTNAILTGLALADLFNMVEYVPFAIYMNFLPDEDGTERKTYPWAVYVLVHSNFSQVCHTISIWLTLTLAVWRYIMISMPLRCKTLCSMERAKWMIASAYLISPLLCIPIYFTFSISAITSPATTTTPSSPYPSIVDTNSTKNVSNFFEARENGMEIVGNESQISDVILNDSNTSSVFSPREFDLPQKPAKYVVNLSSLAKNYPLLMTANFWFYSVVLKLLPCVMLTIVSFRLINSLLEAKKRKEKLLGVGVQMVAEGLPVVVGTNRGIPVDSTTGLSQSPPLTTAHTTTNTIEDPSGGSGSRSGSFTRPTGEMCVTTRTTRMLLAVLLLFLITEFPQGILALLSDLMGDKFFKECYYPLSDLMDFVALLNSAINFILYCTMSTRFRDVFYQVFHLAPILNFCTKLGRRRRRVRENSIVSEGPTTTTGNGGEQILLQSISGQLAARDNSGPCSFQSHRDHGDHDHHRQQHTVTV